MHKAFIIKRVSVLLLFFAFQIGAKAQSNNILIFGRVVDGAKKPIPFATVYLNNTSFFSTTDSLGNYKIWVPTYLQKLELVAGFVGFKPGKVTLSQDGKSKKVLFRLESRTDLAEITVTAKRDRFWKRKWRIFEDGLLGDTPFASKCEILNPEVIKLDYDKTQSKVTAYSREPLLIINKALGYKLQVDVGFFESDGKLTYQATNKYFDSLEVNTVKDLKKIYKNRRRAYDNSFRNFLVSLVNGTTAENGFAIFQMKEIRNVYLGKVSLDDGSSNGFFHRAILRDLVQKDSLIDEYKLLTD
ncbi:carboxypeptidase-like regulatory domain-containing protein [Arcticibacterium luteifluviistationis]|nr:carboxypeptidase-like regulatory domain-containing protein [Arcticibacterium luteifluviistationis]